MYDPRQILTRAQVRELDTVAIRDWGVSGLVLMENAGRGVADVMCELGIHGKVIIACAKGNNGGDGFVIARHLHLRGHDVEILLCCGTSELSGDAAANFDLLGRTSVAVHSLDDAAPADLFSTAEWIVDALLGTGAIGAPRPPVDRVIRAINAAGAKRLAVDLPSGLDCDSGEISADTVKADHTCSFVAPKPGLLVDEAVKHVGRLHVLDIGLPWDMIEASSIFHES